MLCGRSKGLGPRSVDDDDVACPTVAACDVLDNDGGGCKQQKLILLINNEKE